MRPEYRDMEYDNGLIHVYPTFGPEHVLEGKDCWCHPQMDEDFDVLVHNVAQ